MTPPEEARDASDHPGVVRYIQMKIPLIDWNIGRLEDFIVAVREAGGTSSTPCAPPLIEQDPKHPSQHYAVLRCDIDA